MLTTVLALAAAGATGLGAFLTKRLVDDLPRHRVIGPLFAWNAALAAPALSLITWHWSSRIALLHGASVLAMVVISLGVFDLYAFGVASAVTTAQALSPAVAFVEVWLFTALPVSVIQVAGGTVLTAGVLVTLPRAFSGVRRLRAIGDIAAVAVGGATLTVLTGLLTREQVSFPEIYVLRTAVCAVVFLALFPPRGIPARRWPGLAPRALAVTIGFALTIEAVRRGNPAVVQALLATTPLWVLGFEVTLLRRPPPPRLLLAVALVVAGVVALT